MSITQTLKSALAGSRSAVQKTATGIDQLRALRLRLLDERDRVEKTALPREEALSALDHSLDSMANLALEGTHVAHLAGRRDKHSKLDLGAIPERMVGLLVASNREAVRGLLLGKLDEFYANVEVLSSDEKQAELLRIETEVFDVELAEEAAIREAEKVGLPILRRGDADPRAALAADSELPR